MTGIFGMIFLLKLILGVILLFTLSNPVMAEMRGLHVDAVDEVGTIKSLQGVNVGPAHTRESVPDISEQYKDIRVDYVRTHDFYGPGDVDAWRESGLVMFPDFSADPDEESSYNFAPTDRLIKAIHDMGAQVYFRLGRSWGAPTDPPPDLDKWARICVNIVKHYNDGWANGFHFNIKYWEIWNEPNHPMFWKASPEVFYKLFEKTARALKSYDSSLVVGGPGLAGGGRPGAFREGFLQYCRDHQVPLDFFSWHHYAARSRDPYDFARICHDIRRLLDSYGYNETESHINEWNLSLGRQGWEDQVSTEAGAFTASALTYLQDSPVSISCYYRGDAGHPMGLFYPDGRYKKKAYAYKATALMLDTPIRLAATGGDKSGYVVLAGRSEDGQTINILISDYRSESDSYHLKISNLPWKNRSFVLERYVLDDTHDLELVETTTYSSQSDLSVKKEMTAPSVQLLRMRIRG